MSARPQSIEVSRVMVFNAKDAIGAVIGFGMCARYFLNKAANFVVKCIDKAG
jgi:hypothetical protein